MLLILGKLSLQIRTRINCIMENVFPYCNIRFVLQTKYKISNFFTLKVKVPLFLLPGIVCKFQCGGYNGIYYGKIKRHLKVRMREHLGILAFTGKRVKVMMILSLKNTIIPQSCTWFLRVFNSHYQQQQLNGESSNE